ncbi:thioredoxin [Rhizoclosmatium globosum]|uniref:Thioredoxin n=1 Tax=Rhizoclosmatium globosum TaxID=329046 RepID=A0A1Y2BPM4_9FUNG|nr:thioredoxin [Rhizoclosmatium globosum]|eukprot:ORY36686.1 thioredoxin [Rhizoclosmatium globosum]
MFRQVLRRRFSTSAPSRSSSSGSNLIGTIVERGDSDFATTIGGAGSGVVVVDFHATWCGPCRLLAPVLKKVVSAPDSKFFVVKVDVDENPVTAQKYNVASLPTVALFKDGKLLSQFVGLRDEKFVKAWINENLE